MVLLKTVSLAERRYFHQENNYRRRHGQSCRSHADGALPIAIRSEKSRCPIFSIFARGKSVRNCNSDASLEASPLSLAFSRDILKGHKCFAFLRSATKISKGKNEPAKKLTLEAIVFLRSLSGAKQKFGVSFSLILFAVKVQGNVEMLS